ncbi:hypothetical protein, partial [Candidatus Accumulibacter phosphatis]|uniref:hypothetical protein n=1 Tax=Candidatus Accumulibacter phosphatis TaxID=327160 RepID=UPI001B7EE251
VGLLSLLTFSQACICRFSGLPAAVPADGLRSKPSSGKRSAAGMGDQGSGSAVGYRLMGFQGDLICGPA